MFKRLVRWHFAGLLAANGPAIKGVCVTQRSHPATDPGTLAAKLSRWRGGYGTRFCRHVRDLIELYECRGTKPVASQLFILGYKFYCVQWSGPDWSHWIVILLTVGTVCKNRDKQITFIVRVRFSLQFYSPIQLICLGL
jgi:hypothetical protein